MASTKTKKIERSCKRCSAAFWVRAQSEPTKFCGRTCSSRWYSESFQTEVGRVCTVCKRDLPPGAFKPRRSPGGRRSWCLECEKIKQAIYSKRQKAKKYGLTVEAWDRMNQAQEGRCPICLRRPDLLRVDHDHETGQVRSLLCDLCNIGLGVFRESTEALRRAAEYLERWSA